MHTVLVCDDDKDIVEAICIYLEREGLKTLKAFNGLQALEIIHEHTVHLLIMDIMMPEMDGLKATLQIRQKSSFPILLLSAKSEDTDKIIGLNFGADDYLTKPFNPLELIARAKAALRRYTQLKSMPEDPSLLVTGGLCLDLVQKIATVDGDVINLTATEWKILELLMKNMGRVFALDEIYEMVWQEEAFAANNTIAVHIRRIREKIEIDPKNPKYLKVVWGIGYKVEKYHL